MDRLLLATSLVLAACGSKSPSPPPGPALANTAEAPPDAGPDAIGDGACVAACLDTYDRDETLRDYCDELCAPIEEPNWECIDGCILSGTPAGDYDEDGDYYRHEELRSEEEIAAHAAACEVECADVPTVSDEALEDCVRHCDPEMPESCYSRCDPDPYDECRYTPCD